MKKSSIYTLVTLGLSLLSVIGLHSCKKSESSGAAPTITGFRLNLPSPQDTVISAEGPIQAIRPGDWIVIQGTNLDNMKSVLFNGFPAIINTAFSSKMNFVVQVPANIPFADIPAESFNKVTVVTENGSATIDFPIAAPQPLITAVSNELPNPGDKITLYGTGLFAITKLTLPGNIEVPVTTVVSDPGGTFSTLQLPAGFTNQTGAISITTKYGTSTSTVLLNDRSRILCDFDNINTLNAGSTSAAVSNDVAIFPGAHGNFARMTVPNMPAGDWSDSNPGRRIILNDVQWVPAANVNDPTENWALKFEIYVKNPWSGGCLFIHDWDWNRTCRYEPFLAEANGIYVTTGWTTITLPLSNFKSKPSSGPTSGVDGTGTPAATVAELIGSSGMKRMAFLLNNAQIPVTNFDAAIDNIRIVKIK